jgi:TPR repeat protein
VRRVDTCEELRTLLEGDPSAAASRLRELALEGDAQSQLALGQLLINGVGAMLDAAEALRWFRAAADAGLPMAMNMVGRCHEYGFGTAVDYVEAARWYRRAAARGCDWAAYNYAHLLANGRGVRKDRAAAFTWFRLAALRGHARAMNFVGLYCENGWETPMDREAAFDWYRRSAEGGDYRGQCSYASALAEEGRIDEALNWLQQAATTATPQFLAHLAVVLEQSSHGALRAFADALRVPEWTRASAARQRNRTHDQTSVQNRSRL